MMEPDADEEQVAYLAQTEAPSFTAWNRPKKGGKGKGKFKKTFRYCHYSNGMPPNKETLEEKKKHSRSLRLKLSVKRAGNEACSKKPQQVGGLTLN